METSTARIYGGSGLGLNIVSHLVELMGGHLNIVSKVNVGTTFSVILPLRESSAIDTSLITPCTSNLTPPLPENLHVKILVVDDNHINRMVLESFAKRLGCEVDFAENGLQAVRYMERQLGSSLLPLDSMNHGDPPPSKLHSPPSSSSSLSPPPCQRPCSIVFMDVCMPVMNGIEATTRIRQLGVAVPIIGLTADITKETSQAGIQSEMSEILLKPLKYQQFVDCIRKWVLHIPTTDVSM